MNNAAFMDVVDTLDQLSENEVCLALRHLVDSLRVEVAQQVSASEKLCHDIDLIIDGKLLDEIDNIGAVLAKSHGLALANLVFLT